jgi:hypothetical protein
VTARNQNIVIEKAPLNPSVQDTDVLKGTHWDFAVWADGRALLVYAMRSVGGERVRAQIAVYQPGSWLNVCYQNAIV